MYVYVLLETHSNLFFCKLINVHVIDVNNVAACCVLQAPQTQHIQKKSKNRQKYTEVMTTVLFAGAAETGSVILPPPRVARLSVL